MRPRTFALAFPAALILSAVPASAQNSSSFAGAFVAAPDPGGVRTHRGHRDSWRDGRGRHRNHHQWGGGLVYYGGDWALYNNRSFEPESYNDWWHERPNRSLPRWVQNGRDCRQQYWTSAGWTC